MLCLLGDKPSGAKFYELRQGLALELPMRERQCWWSWGARAGGGMELRRQTGSYIKETCQEGET